MDVLGPLLPVSGFASFLAVLFALNVAFGVWGGYIQEFVTERQASTKEALFDGTNKAADAAFLGVYLKQAKGNMDAIEKTVKRWRNAAIIFAFGVLVLLGANGFAPLYDYPHGLEVPSRVMFIGAVAALIPLWSYLHVRWIMRGWRKDIRTRHEMFISLSKILLDERQEDE